MWEQQYSKSVLGDFATPDEDASPPDATVFRDPRDGRPVRGAREDFTSAVAFDGWAVREAVASRWRRLLSRRRGGRRSSCDDALPAPAGASRRGPRPGRGPPQQPGVPRCRAIQYRNCRSPTARHRFSWSDTLAPAAAGRAPKVHAFTTPVPVTAGRRHDAGTVVMMAWRVEYSDQIPPEHLRGWHDDHGDAGPQSTGGVT